MSFYVSLDHFVFVLLVLLCFGFFSTEPRDWLGRTSPKITYFVSSGTLNLALSITVNLTLDFLMITTTAVHSLTTL